METFEDVQAAFVKLASHFMKSHVSVQNYAEFISKWVAPHAGLSISMDGCMEKGRDATNGGCKYNSFGGTQPCLASLADSFAAIKYMIFDKQLCTAREFYDAVMANWEGYEMLRQQIIAEVPHFGNDDPYVDDLMRWCSDTYYDLTRECYSSRTRHFKAGLYGATEHIFQGEQTWATPDGRKTGEPLADASSPAQARDKNGPTAVFNSELTGFDSGKFMDGVALNIKIHPTAMRGSDGLSKWRELTKSYMQRGGMEVQYNIVDDEILKAAQEHPEDYQNLVVRIAGYSAYFVELNEACQNDLISRHAHS
jgi:formate C-acetyltransferase